MRSTLKLYDLTNLSNQSTKITESLEMEILNIISYKDAFDRIEKSLKLFDKTIEEALKINEFIDLKLVREIFLTSNALFRICQRDPWQNYVPFALASISYFLNPNDGENDFESIDGFEDDKLVIYHLIKTFQLDSAIKQEISEIKKNEGNLK